MGKVIILAIVAALGFMTYNLAAYYSARNDIQVALVKMPRINTTLDSIREMKLDASTQPSLQCGKQSVASEVRPWWKIALLGELKECNRFVATLIDESSKGFRVAFDYQSTSPGNTVNIMICSPDGSVIFKNPRLPAQYKTCV